MKTGFCLGLMAFGLLIFWGCTAQTYPTGGSYNYTPTSTPTPVPAGPATISVSTGSSGASATGFIYSSTSGSTGGAGVLSLTAHVGDTINLPGSGLHPLYFDNGTSTCIYTAATTNQSYVIPATGTYYFHCGNHATTCSAGLLFCGSTNCSAMAGILTVN
jgi:hypothetical protein